MDVKQSKALFLVLSGDGINCERETLQAFERAGAKGRIVHINDLIDRPGLLAEFQGLALPGGFSFGDELGSGRLLALKLEHGLGDHLWRFVESKKPIVGICNGLQVLAKLGLLPFKPDQKVLAVTANKEGKFVDSWQGLNVRKQSVCRWTKNLPEQICLPIRHGEGRVVFSQGREKDIYQELEKKGQIPLTYRNNPNGSYRDIAGICDESGLILGMMPHPEAALDKRTAWQIERDVFAVGAGLGLFQSIVGYLES